MAEFDPVLRDLGGLFRACRMYPAGNPQIHRAAHKAAVSAACWGSPLRVVRWDDAVIAGQSKVADCPSALLALFASLAEQGCDGFDLEPDVDEAELLRWMAAVTAGEELPVDASGIRAVSYRGGAVEEGEGVTRPGPLDGFETELLEAFADLRSHRVSGFRRARQIVAAIMEELLTGNRLLGRMLEIKTFDRYTVTHAMDVAVLAAAAARILGTPPDLVDRVGLAGLFHDLGKTRISEEILNKPGALDPDEREIMNRHPEEGARLLLEGQDDNDPLTAVVAYEHHMGADASGYPRPASPGVPHALSLVVAAADVYDALRTRRPYRAAWSAQRAANILLEDAAVGRLHPAAVGALLTALDLLGPDTAVRLSDGTQARVVGPHPGVRALRPVVETATGEVCDLGRHPSLQVAALLDLDPGAAQAGRG